MSGLSDLLLTLSPFPKGRGNDGAASFLLAPSPTTGEHWGGADDKPAKIRKSKTGHA